jgi:hypothetical protein
MLGRTGARRDSLPLIPAKAGTQVFLMDFAEFAEKSLGPRFRGDERMFVVLRVWS